ncbi:MAG: SCO family protein [Hyphomicrobium sp.]
MAASVAALVCILHLAPSLRPPSAFAAHPSRAQGITLDPLFSLKTHMGVPFTRDDIKGKPFVVIFGFTHCPNVCPTTLSEMTTLLETLKDDGDRLRIVFITVDPERDTSEALKAYLTSFDPRIVGLTGSVIDVTAVTSAFNAYFEKVKMDDGYTVDHTLKVFFMDRFGLLARSLSVGANEKQMVDVVRRLLSQ